jgi:hypothetical protein
MGVGLAAACGFRIFIPPLIMSIAALSGNLTLSPSFAWIGTYPALITFAVATVLEITAYYVPWLDNLLDSIATPAAMVAGTIVTASMVSGMTPWMQWTLAIIAGGGAAGLVQASTVLTRAASTATTGGLANPIFATAEWGLSIGTAVASFVAPILVIIALAIIAVIGGRKLWHRYKSRNALAPAASA